jgi:hypothetical protein
MVPGNAEYHALLAEYLEASGANPDAELAIATQLSPDESRYWIRRSFRSEMEQKYDDSERYLLEAHRVDHGFDPRWALMNFYFRRGRIPDYWKAARSALEIGYGNPDPVFRLCLAIDDDPGHTLAILPARREIRFAFFRYLLQHQRPDFAAAIAARLAADAGPDEVPVLVDYSIRQWGHDDASSVSIWNALCRRRLLPFAELAPEKGRIVTNGDFVAPAKFGGFDWRYGPDTQVASQGISIDLNGKQAERVQLLDQDIPLVPGKQYVIRYDYRLTGAQSAPGLEWIVRDPASGEPMAATALAPAAEWCTGQFVFSAGPHNAATLVLRFRRSPGTDRWSGKLQIRRVSSELAK